MSNRNKFRVPDVMDNIYNDVVLGLYTPNHKDIKDNRIIIAKCNIACDYLIRSNSSEMQITSIVDFPSVEEFREAFKGFLGIYPREFRKRFSMI